MRVFCCHVMIGRFLPCSYNDESEPKNKQKTPSARTGSLPLIAGGLPILARGKSGQGLELAGERAVVGVAALQRHVGDGNVGVQQTMGVFQANLLNHLPWRQVEHPLAVSFQLRHGNAGNPRQFSQGDTPIEMRANVDVYGRQPLVGRVRVAGGLQVHRDACQADDFTVAVIERAFVRQAPTGLATAVQMQFQLILQHQALLQHLSILFGIPRPKLCWKHFGAGFPEQGLQLFQITALNQRQVGHDIARLDVLDKNRRIRNHIQHRQQRRHARQ